MEAPFEPSPLLKEWNKEELRYSFVWEDFGSIVKVLKQEKVQPNRILTIASAGENALQFLKFNPEEVIAIDLNPSQIELIKSKCRLIQNLDRSSYLQAIGLRPSGDPSRHNQEDLVHSGRLDRYFKKFRQVVIPKIWNDREFDNLINAPNMSEQMRAFSAGRLSQLKELVAQFFSKSALSTEGRHESQFKYVAEENLGPTFLKRFMQVIERNWIQENIYLQIFLTGYINDHENDFAFSSDFQYEQIKSRLSRLKTTCQDLETFLATHSGKFDVMNFSDVFEYLSETEAEQLFQLAFERLNPGGALIYWTLLVDREPHISEFKKCANLDRIHAEDKTWFYSHFYAFKKNE